MGHSFPLTTQCPFHKRVIVIKSAKPNIVIRIGYGTQLDKKVDQ
ncbi:MAG: hypothetical protein ABSE95_14260 [Thermodesulfobacteriota bacterium]